MEQSCLTTLKKRTSLHQKAFNHKFSLKINKFIFRPFSEKPSTYSINSRTSNMQKIASVLVAYLITPANIFDCTIIIVTLNNIFIFPRVYLTAVVGY